jgi:tetratricopeptide (TPR) repeat protein
VSEALPLLEQGLERPHPNGIWGQAPLYRVWLGEGYVLAGRVEAAMQLGHQALEMARSLERQGYQRQGYEAYALRLLGDVAAHRTPPTVEEAETHYHQALALAEALGMRPLQAHCHRGLGTLYATVGQQEQARTALSAAVELYQAMAMTFWLPQTETALEQVEG